MKANFCVYHCFQIYPSLDFLQNMSFFELPLSSGWTFKDRDDNSPDAWMSVPAVPSTVQQDLIANKRFYSRVIY